MRKLLFIFGLLFASVILGLLLQADPGYVYITIHHWTIETTLWVALVGLGLFFWLLRLIGSTLHKIWQLPQTIRTWLAKRRVDYAKNKTRQGLIEFSEGHWLQAKKQLNKCLAQQ